MPRTLPLLAALLLLLPQLAACGEAESADGGGGTGGAGGDAEPAWRLRPGGPLANAGADRRVLEGLPVRLDGRGSTPGEEGLPIRLLWTQEAGPRVALDDPTSAEPSFVAPPIRTRAGTRLVFRLSADDGRRRAFDRVVVELVDRQEQMVPAPVAVAGADLQVRPGAAVELGEPRTFDPACLDEGGAAGCELVALPAAWEQVEGPPVKLTGTTFIAPSYEAVLTFRLDAHRRLAGPQQPAACGPSGTLDSAVFCSAPDFVRVLVRPTGRIDRAPIALLSHAGFPTQQGGLLRSSEFDPVPASFAIDGITSDPENDARVVRGFRPLLEGAPAGELGRDAQQMVLRRSIDGLDGGWPRTVAMAFETRAGRLNAAPAVALLRWEPAAAGGALPIANAGPNPCAIGQVCIPFVGGDEVLLDGSGSSDADTEIDELVFCWWQTLGPPVAFSEGAACIRGQPRRTFIAPPAPAGGASIDLAFLLTVDDGGPFLGRPDTVILQVRHGDDEPPDVVVEAPEMVDEGSMVALDASGSVDPKGGPLSFCWRQIWTPGAPLVLDPCGNPQTGSGARVQFAAPPVTQDTQLRFEIAVTSRTGLTASRIVHLLVRNSNNEPPAVDAGGDRAVAPGAAVVIRGSARDPNPGDDETLVWNWRLLEGEVELDGTDGPELRFIAPEAAVDRDLLFELAVEDAAGARAVDRIVVSVLARGPYASAAGDDANHGAAGAPVASLPRLLAIARDAGFEEALLAADAFDAPPGELVLEGVVLRGGYDEAAGWTRSAEARTILRLPGGIALGDGAGLDGIEARAAGGAAAQVVRVIGDAALRDTEIDGDGLASIDPAAVRVEAGRLLVEAAWIHGGAGTASSVGIDVGPGASLELINAIVTAGRAPAAIALRSAGPIAIHSSLLRVEPGHGATSATALQIAGGTASLRNSILDAGGSAADRVHLRASGGELPVSLEQVLFVADPGCGSGAFYLAGAAGPAGCTAGALAALDPSWTPLVADPLFVDAAAGDFHLRAESPAVDAGSSVDAPALDAEGRPRGGDGNGDGFAGYDIGPFER